MSRMVTNDSEGMHGNSLPDTSAHLPKKPARMGIDGKDSAFLAFAGASRATVREAMRQSDYSQKSMAIDNKVSEAHVSEGLSGTRHLPWAWVFVSAKTNKSFAVALVRGIAESLDVDQDAEDNEFADICGRMMKMALKVSQRSRRTA